MTKKELVKLIKSIRKELLKPKYVSEAYDANQEALAIITDSGVMNEKI